MRLARPPLIAGTLVLLAAGIGTTVALTTRTAPTTPPTAAPAASPAPAAPSGSTAPTIPTTNPKADPKDDREGTQAVATARAFLARELGMTEMVAGRFRFTDDRAGEVGFRHKYGEGRRLLPQTGPYAAVVRLQRLPAGWWVLGVTGRSIQIDSPARLQRISSPLTVRGKAEVYEGTLSFKVTQDRPGRDLLLGQGFVDGSASTRPGDLGQLRFRQPASDAPGWVTFYEDSAATSGQILQATMVRVQFAVAAPAPRVLGVTTSPILRDLEGWLELRKGPATVRFMVKADHTDRVRFVLTPTGTETGPYAKLLGEDRDPRDGFTLTWSYGFSEAGSGHLSIQAIGPGGKASKELSIAEAA
jgi:Immunoglobulin-like domain of bacterial spore germination